MISGLRGFALCQLLRQARIIRLNIGDVFHEIQGEYILWGPF
jgi:hypothetical protein